MAIIPRRRCTRSILVALFFSCLCVVYHFLVASNLVSNVSVFTGKPVFNSRFHNGTSFRSERTESTNSHLKKEKLMLKLQDINKKQTIHNQNNVTFPITPDTVVLIVQVHDRSEDLRYLIDSLNKVKYIENCLVVFSHDVYLETLNSVISSNAVFPYMQIFFPYSIQLYPKKFPGQDPNDCPRDMDKKQALEKKCNNAEFPDQYNHYREAWVTQTKHHWVWKMNFIFEGIDILQDFPGIFLRLEEDYFVVPDLVYILRQMNSLRKANFPSHKLMIMGTDYEKIPDSYDDDANIVRSRTWCMGKGRGMAFNREFWEDLKTCTDVFCKFDDYGWDWSLWTTARHCMKQPVNVLEIVGSRVFHLGQCQGFHHHNNCLHADIHEKILNVLEKGNHLLFPEILKSEKTIIDDCGIFQFGGYGGWADPRDVTLCRNLMTSDEKGLQKVINDMSNVLRKVNDGK